MSDPLVPPAGKPLRILLVPFGSEGDVNPCIWLAEGLAARGHQPTFIMTPHYSAKVEARGFPCIPLGTAEEFLRFARDPNLWHPVRGPRTVMEGMVNTFPETLTALHQAGTNFDLIVTSTLGLAAAAFAQLHHIPHLMVHLQPTAFRSVNDCPLYAEWTAWFCRAPHWAKKLFYRLIDAFVWIPARKPLNKLRARLGLQPIGNFYWEGLHGADGVAALFPEWFCAAQPDWPANVRQFGFPLSHQQTPLPADLETFLAAGEAPVVWTHGSANFDMHHFQARAVETSRKLGIRSVLVSLDPPAEPLPPNVLHVPHVRFEDLFPHCKLAVHHGGIGTTSKCIAAGIPQIIIPRSHDQPDNAQRVQALGLGLKLHYRDLDSPRLGAAIEELLGSSEVAARCREYQQRLLQAHPLQELGKWIEELAISR